MSSRFSKQHPRYPGTRKKNFVFYFKVFDIHTLQIDNFVYKIWINGLFILTR